MSDILDISWSISCDAVESKVGDETVILHLANGTYYGLDPVGTRIWELLRGGNSPHDICTLLVEEFKVALTTIEKDTRAFLHDLLAHDLVFEASAS